MRRQFRVALAITAFAGCGSYTPRYTVDDVALAPIAINEKHLIFAAQNDIAVARAEQLKARADAEAARNEARVADAEFDQARIETRKARLEQEAAARSHDLNRQARADHARKVAELGERAAASKVDTCWAKSSYFEALADVAEQKVALASVKVELEKAKLAGAKGIQPTKKFKVDDFNNEFARRQKVLDNQRKSADQKKAHMDKLQGTHNALKSQYDQGRAPGRQQPQHHTQAQNHPPAAWGAAPQQPHQTPPSWDPARAYAPQN